MYNAETRMSKVCDECKELNHIKELKRREYAKISKKIIDLRCLK